MPRASPGTSFSEAVAALMRTRDRGHVALPRAPPRARDRGQSINAASLLRSSSLLQVHGSRGDRLRLRGRSSPVSERDRAARISRPAPARVRRDAESCSTAQVLDLQPTWGSGFSRRPVRSTRCSERSRDARSAARRVARRPDRSRGSSRSPRATRCSSKSWCLGRRARRARRLAGDCARGDCRADRRRARGRARRAAVRGRHRQDLLAWDPAGGRGSADEVDDALRLLEVRDLIRRDPRARSPETCSSRSSTC